MSMNITINEILLVSFLTFLPLRRSVRPDKKEKSFPIFRSFLLPANPLKSRYSTRIRRSTLFKYTLCTKCKIISKNSTCDPSDNNVGVGSIVNDDRDRKMALAVPVVERGVLRTVTSFSSKDSIYFETRPRSRRRSP